MVGRHRSTVGQLRYRGGQASLGALVAAVLVVVLLCLGHAFSHDRTESHPTGLRAEAGDEVPTGPLAQQRVVMLPPPGGDPLHRTETAWVRIYGDFANRFVEVILGNRRVISGWGRHLEIVNWDGTDGFGVGVESVPEDSGFGSGPLETDMNGDGVPEVVIAENTLGAHCCVLLHICQLWPVVRVQTIDGGDFGIAVVQKDGDRALEIHAHDPGFTSVHGSYAQGCAVPGVVLKFDGAAWTPSAPLTREPLAEFSGLEWPAPDSTSPWDQEIWPWFPGLMDLIYAGHAAEAWKALDAMWPSHPSWAPQVRSEVIQLLKRSEFWPLLVELNGPALDP